MPNIHIDLTHIGNVINNHFYDLLWNEDDYLVMYGGAGSGKSVFAAQKVLLRILMDLDTDTVHRILVLRKYGTTLGESVYEEFVTLIREWNLWDLVVPRKSPPSFEFIDGSRIIMRGLDGPEKLKSIKDITSVWMEEATEFTQEDFDEIERRLRADVNTYLQIMLTFNPVSKLSWLYDTFVRNNMPDTTIHHSTFINNAFLADSEKYKNKLTRYKDTKNEHQYKVYYLGEWGSLEGLIYTNWQEYDHWPVCDEIVYGCDFGFDDPTAVVKVGASKDGFYIEELLYNSDMTNDDLIEWIKRKDLAGEPKIYCDSANPDRIEALKRAGIRAIPSKKGQGSVQAGIDFVKGKDLYVKGKNLLNEIQDYTYKKDRHGRSMEKPEDGNDHLLDAMRYAIFTRYAQKMDFTFITSGD